MITKMTEPIEGSLAPTLLQNPETIPPQFPIACPPSLTKSPLLLSPDTSGPGDINAITKNKASRIPRNPPRLICGPFRNIFHFKEFNPQDDWLPITASRDGNKYYAAFHTLCSGIGIRALVVPVAFTSLGWTWGIISLTLAFTWQFYTLWLLVQLHESSETGMRYNRYLQLFAAAFDNKIGKSFAWMSIMYLSSGTCVAMIIIGGSTLKYFFHVTCNIQILTAAEWYLVFTCMAVILSQLPNLNAIAGVSLIGAITAVGYCTFIWVVSVAKSRLPNVSYEPVREKSDIGENFQVLNALGIIAFAFTGHNLTLEIQATMPSTEKHPSRVPMWKGVMVAYALIAMSLFPIAIGSYWVYGHEISKSKGMLSAFYHFHSHDVSRFVLGLTSLFVVVNALTSFPIYAIPTFDDLESKYTSKNNKPCPWWRRFLIRALFGYINYLGAVALPVCEGIAGLVGGLILPVTMAYPCFMWLNIKKPKLHSTMWWLNWSLGILGMVLSSLLTAAGAYIIINNGVHGSFFKPK